MKKRKGSIRLLPLLTWVAAVCTGLLPAAADEACQAFSGEKIQDLFEFDPGPEAVRIVDELVEASSLSRTNFSLRAANVDSAAAVICGSEHRLLYSANFFAGLSE